MLNAIINFLNRLFGLDAPSIPAPTPVLNPTPTPSSVSNIPEDVSESYELSEDRYSVLIKSREGLPIFVRVSVNGSYSSYWGGAAGTFVQSGNMDANQGVNVQKTAGLKLEVGVNPNSYYTVYPR